MIINDNVREMDVGCKLENSEKKGFILKESVLKLSGIVNESNQKRQV